MYLLNQTPNKQRLCLKDYIFVVMAAVLQPLLPFYLLLNLTLFMIYVCFDVSSQQN